MSVRSKEISLFQFHYIIQFCDIIRGYVCSMFQFHFTILKGKSSNLHGDDLLSL